MDGTENKEANGAKEELVAMKLQEAAGIFMHAGHVESEPKHDGVVAFEAVDGGDGLGVDGETLFKEIVGDGVGDFLSGSVASGPGNEHGGRHGNLRRSVKLRAEGARTHRSTEEGCHWRERLSVSGVTGDGSRPGSSEST